MDANEIQKCCNIINLMYFNLKLRDTKKILRVARIFLL